MLLINTVHYILNTNYIFHWIQTRAFTVNFRATNLQYVLELVKLFNFGMKVVLNAGITEWVRTGHGNSLESIVIIQNLEAYLTFEFQLKFWDLFYFYLII